MTKTKQKKRMSVKNLVATKEEEVIKQICLGKKPLAKITRSAQEPLILATHSVMFADIDLWERPAYDARFSAGARRVLDIVHDSPTLKRSRQSEALKQVGKVADSMPDLGFRIYETAAGYRLLMTSTTFSPTSKKTENILKAFGSDPLYIKFCRAQKDFRARLSAKNFRCGATRPPCRFPFASEENRYMYRSWERVYHGKADAFAVCRYVSSMGPDKVCEAAQAIVEIHDRLTIADGALLA